MKMVKELGDMIVVHPKDKTTQMLGRLYEGLPCQKLDTMLSKNQLRSLLYATPSSEHIMLLGHGCGGGLLTRDDDTIDDFKQLIDHSFSHILKKHNGRIFAVFCHAKDFAEKERLHGLFSGMIISEIPEKMPLLDDRHTPLTEFNYHNFFYL